MKIKVKNVNINIKKLAPTLTIGGTAAAATPAIVQQFQNTSNSVVVNNYLDGQKVNAEITTQHSSSTTIKIKGLPDLKAKSGESLGSAWKQYLLHAPNDKRWLGNEKELLRSSETSAQGIKSELFKEAKRRIQSNRRVSGGEIYKVCRKAYQMGVAKTDKKVIKDV